MYSNAFYANAENTLIKCDYDGNQMFVPVDENNRFYQEIMILVNNEELEIGDYVPPEPDPSPGIPEELFMKDANGNVVRITVDGEQRITTEQMP